jgi:acyl-CoA synthetase (AMP-forming)/AMP-acid ligase II
MSQAPLGADYLDGVEVESGRRFAPTMPGLIREMAARHGDQEFLVLGDRRISFADADRISAELAQGLLAMGLGKSARVGLLMPNNPDWVLCFMAASRIGALTVALSTMFQAPEISWALRHNDIDTLIIASDYLSHDYVERLERAVPGLADQASPELHLASHPFLRRIIVWGGAARPWALAGPAALEDAASAKPFFDRDFLAAVEANVAPADWLLTICTSGSTAEPKAVVHTHGNSLRAVHLFTHYLDVRPGDRNYTGNQFFWIGGLNMNLIPAMFVGACMCFTQTPKSGDVVDLILREKVTRVHVWPAQAQAIIDEARRRGQRLTSVRSGLGAPRDQTGEIIPPHRRHASQLGMTESFGMHSMEVVDMPSPPGKGGNWGRKMPGVERKIVDPETGAELPPGQIGELYIRGHTLMAGYYKVERVETFLRDGFFPTGDLAAIDEDDFVWFHGRNSEMIKTSGANVSPREVELAIYAMPQVQEAIVFGAPDSAKGEIVIAVVAPAAGADLGPEAVKAHLRAQVSAYKVPAHVVVIPYEEVPRTGSLKPKKPDLRAMVFARLGLAEGDA